MMRKELIDTLDRTPGDPVSYYKFTAFFVSNWDRVEGHLYSEQSDGNIQTHRQKS